MVYVFSEDIKHRTGADRGILKGGGGGGLVEKGGGGSNYLLGSNL